MQYLTNERHDWLATKFFMNQEVLCINPKILVNECKWECYTWIKNAIVIRTLTMLIGFEEIWLKALNFWLCVFERVMAVWKWMIKLGGCLVLKLKIKHSVALADQAEPKIGFRLYGLRVPWELQEKFKRDCLDFCGFILMFKTKVLGLMSLWLSLGIMNASHSRGFVKTLIEWLT